MLRISAPAVLSAAVLAAGCGGGDKGENAERYSGDEQDVAQVVDDLQTASRDGAAGRICDEIFTKELADLVAKQTDDDCETRVAASQVSDDATLRVESIRLLGEQGARARVKDQAGRLNVLVLAKQDGAWRIDDIAR